jgi:hypothetical protein
VVRGRQGRRDAGTAAAGVKRAAGAAVRQGRAARRLPPSVLPPWLFCEVPYRAPNVHGGAPAASHLARSPPPSQPPRSIFTPGWKAS